MTTSPDYHSVTSHQINQFNMLTEIRVGSRFVSNQTIKGKVGSTISILGKQLFPESNTRVYNKYVCYPIRPPYELQTIAFSFQIFRAECFSIRPTEGRKLLKNIYENSRLNSCRQNRRLLSSNIYTCHPKSYLDNSEHLCFWDG